MTRLYNGLEVPDMGYSREVYDAALAALSPADFVPVADCYGGDGR